MIRRSSKMPSQGSPAPEISVAMPFRDAGQWIGCALESLRAQTFGDFEILMVDDGSSDDGASIAASFASLDPRFRLVSAPLPGIAASLNHAIALSRGRWIARLDADDACHPRRLEAQLALARSMGSGAVISCLVRCTGEVAEGWRLYERWVNSLVRHEEIVKALFIESPVPHPTAFFARETVLEAGGYSEGLYPEDYELWLRLWSKGARFGKVPEVLLDWRERPDRLSRTSRRYSTEAFFLLKARYIHRAPLMEGHDSVVLWGAGPWGRKFADLLAREGISVEAFVDVNPRRIGGCVRGRPVIPPERLPEMRGVPVLVCVRSRGARGEISSALTGMGFEEGADFLLCT